MNKFLTLFILLLNSWLLLAQQQQQHTQFMYNKLGLNAGYAGSGDASCLTGIYRNQWIGLEGAPNTQTLAFDLPLLNKRIGAGLNLTRNSISISERWTLDGIYAYRIKLGQGRLGMGLRASVRYFSMNYADPRLSATQGIAGDNGIPFGAQNKYLPNFGAGIYYSSRKFYAGVSVPRILTNSLEFRNENNNGLSKEVLHFYAMGGLNIDLTDELRLIPQLLLKYAVGAPFDFEVNVMAQLNEKYTGALTYRGGGSGLGASIDIMLGMQLTEALLFGLSYDLALSEIKTYNSGSLEAVVRFCFDVAEGNDVLNPRFF